MGVVLSGTAAPTDRLSPRTLRRPSAAPPIMNAPLLPEVLLRGAREAQEPLPLASEGALRYVWESRYGAILIEVVGDDILVNGKRVELHRA